jgi:DNA-binding NtrC family response regulator
MNARWEILIASSDVEIGQSIVTIIAGLGLNTFSAFSVGECREVLAKQSVGLIFCSRRFKDGVYKDVVALTGLRQDRPRIVLATAYIDPQEYHEAKQLGVFDVISSPYHSTTVEWMVIQTMRDRRKLESRPQLIKANLASLPKTSVAAAGKH